MYTLKSFHTNYLVSAPGNDGYMLVDCGSDIRMSLATLNVPMSMISAVYITHCHADHAGGLQYLAFSSIFRPAGAAKIKLYCSAQLAGQIWHMLEPACHICDGLVCTLGSYFDVVTMHTGEESVWGSVSLTPVPWDHVKGYDVIGFGPDRVLMDRALVSYGVTLRHSGVAVHVTGDVHPDEVNNVAAYLMQDDVALAFVDCDTNPVKHRFPVHPKLEDWARLPDDVKRRLRLIHYNDNVMEAGAHPDVTPGHALRVKIAGLRYAAIHESYDTKIVGEVCAAPISGEPRDERSHESGPEPESRPESDTGECGCTKCRAEYARQIAEAAHSEGKGQSQG